MIENKPQYRIKYVQCAQAGHEGQKLNFVCLEKHCRQSSLICTLCRQSKHHGHSTKPLKFYFDDLRKQYQSNEIDYPSQLAQLEKNKNSFLLQLKETVIRIANQFQKLQAEILQRFDKIRNQILENESRKNQFAAFYNNLTKKMEEDPQFIMKNYLPHQEIQEIRNIKAITKIADILCSELIKTRQSLFVNQPKEQFTFLKNLNTEQLYLKPANILKEGFIFTQTSFNTADPPSVVLLNIPIKELLQQKTTIKVKTTQLRKLSKLVLGVMSKQLFLDLKYMWKDLTSDNIMWLKNNGTAHASYTKNLTVINQGLNLDLTLDKQQFKISSKKATTSFKLNDKHQWYFFFCLQGKAKLEVSF